MEDLDQYINAYDDSFPYARDNHGVLIAYAKELVNACKQFDKKIDICSLGIGYEIVSHYINLHLANKIAEYTVIEGSAQLIARYNKDHNTPYTFNLIHDFFETYETALRFDVIEMGFILEHVKDPAMIVSRFSKLLKPNGIICAAVPNALSMHRVLGARAGLLNDLYALNEWDIKLGHRRYFDRHSFSNLFHQLGLLVAHEKGLMLKPFSTHQMNLLNLPDNTWDTLFHSGDLAPDYAYGLYAEVCMRKCGEEK
ncbi:MAG: methyltransferase domain-containing protein [Pseudomonadales bacterium]|jgi:2-polyprenyl-3-methyl-5-hydroxy-6-metoxy-1,4-benzoquinol methylase